MFRFEFYFKDGQGISKLAVALFTAGRRLKTWMNSVYKDGAIFKLWETDIKQIEGEFGTGIGTYFRFLRDTFFLHLLVGILRYVLLCIRIRTTTAYTTTAYTKVVYGWYDRDKRIVQYICKYCRLFRDPR